jgi:hypothetical protein
MVGPIQFPFSKPFTFAPLPSKTTLAVLVPSSINPSILLRDSFVFAGAIS